jgi:hypothetical protein
MGSATNPVENMMLDAKTQARLDALEMTVIHLAHALADMQRETAAGALIVAVDRAERLPANETADGALSGSIMAAAFQRMHDALMRAPSIDLPPPA